MQDQNHVVAPEIEMIRVLPLLALAAGLVACAPAVRVADGNTIIAGDKHYRLWGIDAPELHQTCADGWPAGAEARRTLEALIGERRVVCEDRGYDRYGRIVGLCRVAGQDLGAAMVGAGMALASQRHDYVGIEHDARDEGRGLHEHGCTDWEAPE